MRIKRAQPRPSFISTKGMVIIFIGTMSLIASLNLSPSIIQGLPSSDIVEGHSVTTVRAYKSDDNAIIVEHDFSGTVDPAEHEGLEELEAELRNIGGADEEEEEEKEAAQLDQFSEEIADLEEREERALHEDDAQELEEIYQQEEEQEEEEPEEEQQEEKSSSHLGKRTGTDAEPAPGSIADKYHVIVTVSEGTYVEWQARVCYFWYKKIKAENPNGAMGGFTRLLHSGVPDRWMDEIPTVVVDPLPREMDEIVNGYVVLNRPYGLMQWVRDYLDKIPEQYVLMSEPDHIFIRSPPLWATPERAAAYPFFYIEPHRPENAAIIKKFNKKKVPIDKFAPIGNSPVMISAHQMRDVVNIWANLSIAVKQDKVADEKWGWVQEMYAWSIASTQIDVPVEYDLYDEFMLQPPWDAQLEVDGKPAYIIHFTYGDDFDSKGEFTPGKVGKWHFDKRDYMERYPPMNFPMPPAGCTNAAVMKIISALNEASANLPHWAELAYGSVEEVRTYYGNEDEENEEEEGEEEGDGGEYEAEEDVYDTYDDNEEGEEIEGEYHGENYDEEDGGGGEYEGMEEDGEDGGEEAEYDDAAAGDAAEERRR